MKDKELNVTYALKNGTIAELVEYMTENNIPMSAQLACDMYDGGSVLLFWEVPN